MAKKPLKRATMPAQEVPQSVEAAIALLEKYAGLDADLAEVNLAADRAKAEIDAHRDQMASPVVAEMKALVKALKPFWEARRHEITGGRRKSVVLGGCEIGTRTGNPTLAYPKDREDELIEAIDALGFREWALREVLELDKPALLKALRPETDDALDLADAAALSGLGFDVRQTETFFVARAQSEPAEAANIGREAA